MRTRIPRFFIVVGSIAVLLVIGWLGILFQQKQHLVGCGINRPILFLLINAHVIIGGLLLYIIIRNGIKLYIERRRQEPGSTFKRNLLFAFVVFSVVPVTFVFFVAGKLIPISIDNWFQARLGAGLENSLVLHEQHTKAERANIERVAQRVKKALGPGIYCQDMVQVVLQRFGEPYKVYLWGERGFPFVGSIRDEVRVWRTYRDVNDRTTKNLRYHFFEKFKSQQSFDFYGSLYCVERIGNLFLVVVYRYPPVIRYHLIQIQNALWDYVQLKTMRRTIYWNYFLTFLLLTLLILFLSVWCAFFLARGISRPIQDLLVAVGQVRKGDFKVQVPVEQSDDLRLLVIGFNEMTYSLQQAYQRLEFANKEMLTMLEHIKESVFFVNSYGRILSFNASAKNLIEQYLHVTQFSGKRINVLGSYVQNIFFSLVREVQTSDKTYLSKEISFFHEGETKTFMVYVAIIQNAVLGSGKGILVVAEDLSEVYKMNKIKTWQEAAKQMAHEIKNPLTPIQLATQRLQRKGCDERVLLECTDTILQQVRIIKDLVSHFSEFAQMPGPHIEQLDIHDIIKEVASLYEISYPDISFSYDFGKFLPAVKADRKHMKRVMVNLLDNSVRALQKSSSEKKIFIKTSLKIGRNQIELLIGDNGPGIPRDVKETLFLPYVSSSSKNMGLGLAIVHDIMVQAGGSIKLMPSEQGAVFQILLPV
jgi:Signal transduction histidine kinase involved in nitrogen fixation and metabolism regulation